MADDTVAQRNADAISKRGGQELAAVPRAVRNLLNARSLSGTQKYIKLTLIADFVGELAAPNSPCKRGCSHCCNQAVPISEHEADRISANTGRTRRYLPHRDKGLADRETVERIRENQWRYHAQPCPFLKAGECSIYEVRPMNCRTHISVAADARPCDIFSNPGARVPLLNMSDLQNAVVELFAGRTYGDIREYFPEG